MNPTTYSQVTGVAWPRGQGAAPPSPAYAGPVSAFPGRPPPLRGLPRFAWGLVPLMLAAVTLEQGLRIGIGQLKPLETEHAPPGALSWGLLPLAGAALAWSVSSPRGRTTGNR